MPFFVFIYLISFTLLAEDKVTKVDPFRLAIRNNNVIILKLKNKNSMFVESKASTKLEDFVKYFTPLFTEIQNDYTAIEIYSGDTENHIAAMLIEEFLKLNFNKAKLKLANKELKIKPSIKENYVLLIFTEIKKYDELREFFLKHIDAYISERKRALNPEVLSSELPAF
ncbi:MAG: hypothetical protein ACPGJV_10640 [Bacteriovoracaceae bacterium]